MSKKKVKKRSGSMMGRSDIPYAQRLKMRHQSDIIGNDIQAFIEDDGTPVLPRKWKEVQQ